MPDKEDIIAWLATIGKDRKWLADKCLVSVGQCYNWFSRNGRIPAAKLALIKSLIDATSGENPPDQVITLEFSGKEMEIVNQFRSAFPDIDLAEYARGKVFELCSSMIESSHEFEETPLIVAEEEDAYAAAISSSRIHESRQDMLRRYESMTPGRIVDEILGPLPFKRTKGHIIKGKGKPIIGEQAE